jgi:hypothetical protein
MIELRVAETDEELELRRGVRRVLRPNERTPSMTELHSNGSFRLLASRRRAGGFGHRVEERPRRGLGHPARAARVGPAGHRDGVAPRLALHSEECGYDEIASMVDDEGSYTWTQTGNENMREVNERLGFVTRAVSVIVRRGLPL